MGMITSTAEKQNNFYKGEKRRDVQLASDALIRCGEMQIEKEQVEKGF